jgi:hypothetical protein
MLSISLNKYRYILDPGSKKYRCPSCGEKRFVIFIDTETGENLPDFGRCDREQTCGYFNYPGEKSEKSEALNKTFFSPPQTRYIEFNLVERSMQAYSKNNFIIWLRSLYGDDIADTIIQKYRLGTTTRGNVIFWLINRKGLVCNGHEMEYSLDGHRQNFNRYLYRKDAGYKNCLFGEHLLNDKPVAITESEKTAIIASIYYPQYIWLASSGSNGLTSNKIEALRGCRVYLFPDFSESARSAWDKKIKELQSLKIDAFMVDLFPQVNDGSDLADILIKPGVTGFAENKHGYPVMWDIYE